MLTNAQTLGLLGERIAARWLRRRGWRILAHRFQNGHRDLDLVAQLGEMVAFVEVKTRTDLCFGGPASAVDFYKLQQLRRLEIGYGRAARIIDQLEHARILGPRDAAKPSKPRDVLAGLEDLDRICGTK